VDTPAYENFILRYLALFFLHIVGYSCIKTTFTSRAFP